MNSLAIETTQPFCEECTSRAIFAEGEDAEEALDLAATVPRILKVDFSFARFLLTEDAE